MWHTTLIPLTLTLLYTNTAFAANNDIDLGAASFHKLLSLEKRQTSFTCPSVPVGPNLCERSCGPGYESCVYYDECFNPSKGQICCSDGSYCDAGEQCTTAGCCKADDSLQACAASLSLSAAPSALPTRTGFSVASGSSSSSGAVEIATNNGAAAAAVVAALPTLGAALAGIGGIGALLL